MFDYLTTYHYGRCIKSNEWYLKTIGVNRLYRINRGNLTILLDNRPFSLKEGNIYLFPQNLKFEPVLTADTQVDHTFLDFFTIPAIKMDSMIEINPDTDDLLKKAGDILFTLTEVYPTYPNLMRNDHSDLIESYLQNLLFLIDRDHPISRIQDPRINRALDFIHRNYDREITLENLLALTNLEKNYFIRIFKASMNITPYQYIKKYRFNIALTMLKHKSTLKEAAEAIGYSDAAAFSHAFKKIYGLSPRQVMQNGDPRV